MFFFFPRLVGAIPAPTLDFQEEKEKNKAHGFAPPRAGNAEDQGKENGEVRKDGNYEAECELIFYSYMKHIPPSTAHRYSFRRT